MASCTSHTAPRRVSFDSVPSSSTVTWYGFDCAQSSKCLTNLWFDTTIYSSTAPDVCMSSSSQSSIVFSPTLRSGLGKFSVSG